MKTFTQAVRFQFTVYTVQIIDRMAKSKGVSARDLTVFLLVDGLQNGSHDPQPMTPPSIHACKQFQIVYMGYSQLACVQ
jgi:hypothetical protein